MHFKIAWKTCIANKPVSISKWSQTSRPANFEGQTIKTDCFDTETEEPGTVSFVVVTKDTTVS